MQEARSILTEQSPPTARLKFRGAWIVVVTALLIMSWMMVFGIIAIKRQDEKDIILGAVLILVGVLLFGFMPLGFLVFRSDILLDDYGISRLIFNKNLRSMPWRNVKELRLMTLPTFTSRGLATTFFIDQIEPPKSKKIYFTEEVNDIQMLVDTLNYYIRQYEIPLYTGTRNNKIRLDQIRLSDCIAASKRDIRQ
jgi:hypothetical protein